MNRRQAITLIGGASAGAAMLGPDAFMETAAAKTAPPWPDAVAQLADEYFDQIYFRYAPTQGTLAGFHQYDPQLEDYSAAAVQRQTADLKRFLPRIGKLRKKHEAEARRRREKIGYGKPGTASVVFKGMVEADGTLIVQSIVASDPGLSRQQIELLKQKAEAMKARPDIENGVPVPTETTMNVVLEGDDSAGDDLDMVESAIRSSLLTLETIRPWEKNPDSYSSGIANSAFSLMERNFASPDDRLRSLIARERQMPAALAAARQNLQNPPHISTEIALEQLPGILSFFQSDVPEAFKGAKDAGLRQEFAQSNAAVIAALTAYQQWLQQDLLPRSNGDYRIGAETFRKKLLYDEMVDTPLPDLLQTAYGDLHKNQADFERIAHEVDPAKTPRQMLAELGQEHPAPDQLLATFRDTFSGLIGFIRQKKIVTIPSDVRPIVEETPPFMRATTFASMDTPGPFEKHATEAYFNVTLPGPHDTPEQIAGVMAGFNRGTIQTTSIHEAYPGHYVQFLWVPQAPSKVRKLLGANTNVEGWAHYCEQMMLDEGYCQPGTGAKDARDAKMVRLGQLQDALLRDARFVVSIRMHTGQMSFDEAVDFFVNEGYQSRENALVEVKRGTSDPTYLYYTLGKLEIMKLRADVERKQGAAFSLERFHDDFLRQGFPPIKIVRGALLGAPGPAV